MTARFGPFRMDVGSRQLSRDDVDVHLTPKAFDLLALLIEEAPRVVPKAELHSRLWPNTFVSDATLLGLVKEARRALGDERRGTVIRTAHRIGYSFAGELDRAVAKSSVARWLVAGGRRIRLNDGDNLIGRDPSAAVYLDVAGISRRHARIVVTERRATIEDLESKNGTSVSGEFITGPTELHDEDQIHVGGATLIFRSALSGISTETVAGARARSKRAP